MRMAVRMPVAGTITKKRGEKIVELGEIVSTALRGTETSGSCTMRHSEYDVDEDTGGVDDVKTRQMRCR